jgi:hypothetical protein
MFRVRNRHRRRILIKAPAGREATIDAVRRVVEHRAADRTLRGVAIGVDVDPQ